jgi:hypothetical protein
VAVTARLEVRIRPDGKARLERAAHLVHVPSVTLCGLRLKSGPIKSSESMRVMLCCPSSSSMSC